MLCLQRDHSSRHSNIGVYGNNVCTFLNNMLFPPSQDKMDRNSRVNPQPNISMDDERTHFIRLFDLIQEVYNPTSSLKSCQVSNQGSKLLKSLQFDKKQNNWLEFFCNFRQQFTSSPLRHNFIDLSTYSDIMSKVHDLKKVSPTAILKSQLSSKMSCALLPSSSAVNSSITTVVSINADTVLNTDSNTNVDIGIQTVNRSAKKKGMHIMNQELVNRKCRKMNKLSKRKRRRKKNRDTSLEKPSSHHIKQVSSTTCETTIDKSNQNVSDHTTVNAEIKFCQNEVIVNIDCQNLHICGFVESASEDDIDYINDDDDWDSTTSAVVMDDLDFGFFSPLLTESLMSLHISGLTSPVKSHHVSVIEVTEMSPELCQVNERWHMIMSDIQSFEKVPSKVCFSEVELVTIFPVDVYDRKGEWELYARERCHFKRRIQDVEKILSPYLSPSHREKVYKQLINSDDS